MSTTTDNIAVSHASRSRIRFVASLLHVLGLAVALVVLGLPTPAAARGGAPEAAPAEGALEPAASEPAAPEAAAPEPAAPSTVEAALEAGDLERAMALATEARTKDPTPAAWRTEAEVAERRGDLAAAEAAYRGELEALPAKDAKARAQAEQDLARVQAKARGAVPGEPKSSHRAELDRKWAEPAPAASPEKRRSVPPPGPRPREDRIVTKWYFWVTVGAIVASAAAVTAIAIRAARDDEPDALGLEAGPRSMGATLLRF